MDASKMPNLRKRVLVDFDGTVGPMRWPSVPEQPYPGFVKAMLDLRDAGFEVWIFTARAWPGWIEIMGRKAYEASLQDVHDWLTRWHVPYAGVTCEKMPAMYLIDDRALNPGVYGWSNVVSVVLESSTDPYGER